MQRRMVISYDVSGQPINLLVPPSRVKKSKRENIARLKLTEAIFFFWIIVHYQSS